MLDLFQPPKIRVKSAKAVMLLSAEDGKPEKKRRVYPKGRPTHPRTAQDHAEKYRRYVEKYGREYINLRRRKAEGLRTPLSDGTRGPYKKMEVARQDLPKQARHQQQERIHKRAKYWTDPQYREAKKARARELYAAKKGRANA
jgi:hypothetical protein